MKSTQPAKPASNALEVSFTIEPTKRGRPKSAKESAPSHGHQLGRTPRVSRLMALAIRFHSLVQCGDVRDYADLARLGYVTRARITQIMDLTLLAPDIQEAILFLPPTVAGGDRVKEKDLRPIAAVALWPRQRKMWAAIRDAAR